uniref:hypothetical protein n=1 Tax=Pseudomonas sp. EA_35y_Pfl1_P108 TaxID=3088688 RepID=UPI0030D9A054
MSNIPMNNVSAFKPALHTANSPTADTLKDIEKASGSLAGLSSRSNALPRNDSPKEAAKDITVNADALEKLFEMFELVFKAMRSVLSGRGFSAKLPVDVGTGVQIGVKGNGKQATPVNGEKGAQVKVGTDGSVQVGVKGNGTESTRPTGEKGAQVKVGTDGSVQVGVKGNGTESKLPSGEKGAIGRGHVCSPVQRVEIVCR